MTQNRAKELVAEARKIARRVDSWIELSNALADPQGGLIARYFPDPDERRLFLQSADYEELNQLLRQSIRRNGLYPSAGRGKNGTARRQE